MKDELLEYYERELTFIRETATEFAQKHPKVAGRLELEPNKCEDPHVERLIEAFALLAGRVNHKLDAEFPEITEAFLGTLYPHYIRPIPSLGIVQFEMDPDQSKASAYRVERNATLYTDPVHGTPCQFRTCYPVSLWPIEVVSATVVRRSAFPPGLQAGAASAAIRVELRSLAMRIDALEIDRLRFFLDGPGETVHTLYELLLNNTPRVIMRDPAGSPGAVQIMLKGDVIREAGFGRDEGMLPYSDRSFLGYRHLQEYFSFPDKFLFVDLCGLERLARSGLAERVEVWFLLENVQRQERLIQLEERVNRAYFRLGCAPVVNLFERAAEPIRLTHAKSEYRVIADIHNESSTEVYSVDRVVSAAPHSEETREFAPFYSLRHVWTTETQRAFWYSTRRPSTRKGDAGTEVYLSFADADFSPRLPHAESVTPYITCSNRDVPGKLPFAGEWGEFQLESASIVRVRSVRKPTGTTRPPSKHGLQWRLISHLSLNHLSITAGGREGLQELLKLYDFSDGSVVRKQIEGITNVACHREVARVRANGGVAFTTGTDIAMEFDEEQYAGAGVFLMAVVLERFLGLYSAINSFSRLTATTKQRKGVMRRWDPRSGEQPLV